MHTVTAGQFLSEAKRLGKPWALILIGLPGSGKSTFVKQVLARVPIDEKPHISSLDNKIEFEGALQGLNYTEAFKTLNIGALSKQVKVELAEAATASKNIIIDQTNMSQKSRREKLALLEAYTVGAVVFEVDAAELNRRLATREAATGKHIPQHVLESMAASYQSPTGEEGFKFLIKV